MSETSTLPYPVAGFKLRRWHLIAAGMVVLLSGVWIVLRQQRAVDVELTSPVYEDIESTVSATGTVTPAVDFAARAAFAGIVDKLYVHVGESVRQGQLLAYLRDQYAGSRVKSAQAALQAAELNDQNLKMNGSNEERIAEATELEHATSEQAAAAKALATLQQLRQAGSASDAEVANATQHLGASNAALAAAQQKAHARYKPEDLKNAALKVAADKASLEAERVSYGNAHIASPIAGTVYVLPVKQYDFVQMGADILHVADLKKLAVRASFYEPDIKQLRAGEPVRITWNGAPGHTWNGRLESRPMAVSGEGVLRTGECMVTIDGDTDGLPVNTNVTVTATVQKHAHVLTLPREAVREEGAQHFVYRVSGSELKKTPVNVGLVNAMKIEITSGLDPADRVAVRVLGDGKLENNARVKPEGRN